MNIDLVTVVISRHAGVDIEKVVKPWEVRLLKRIHGDANVQETGRTPSEGEFDALEEYGALQRKYASATDTKAEPILPQVYPDAYALEDVFHREQRQREPRKPKHEQPAA